MLAEQPGLSAWVGIVFELRFGAVPLFGCISIMASARMRGGVLELEAPAWPADGSAGPLG